MQLKIFGWRIRSNPVAKAKQELGPITVGTVFAAIGKALGYKGTTQEITVDLLADIVTGNLTREELSASWSKIETDLRGAAQEMMLCEIGKAIVRLREIQDSLEPRAA